MVVGTLPGLERRGQWDAQGLGVEGVERGVAFQSRGGLVCAGCADLVGKW